ncbi:hypothetical protein FOA52_008758 [Chlamydomonas sp. UWO 241]|nr:hypothetical protein FOA52_008758 [Chlamydomonas sp. UWO 241]
MCPVDWASGSRWSDNLKAMPPSSIVAFAKEFAGLHDCVRMHIGLPSPDSFPLASLTATNAPRPRLYGPTPISSPDSPGSSPGSDVRPKRDTHTSAGEGKLGSHTNVDDGVDGDMSGSGGFSIKALSTMSEAQQYNFTAGYAPLVDWCRATVSSVHEPPNGAEVCVTAGSTQAVAAVIQCLTDPGDFILCEEYTFAAFIETIFMPRKLVVLPVTMDSQGLLPEALEAACVRGAEQAAATGRRPPRVLYTIPSGQNPTGAVMGLARKHAIYAVAQKWDLVIIEDDAYWWLQYGDEQLRSSHTPGSPTTPDDMPGMRLPPSFLSLDTDSRVVRVDTFSKILGPGYRIGWLSGPAPLVDKVAQVVQGGSAGPCSLSMVVVSEMLSAWGPARFEGFLRQQQAMYRSRADAADAAARQYLSGKAEWAVPTAGMFVFVRLTCLPDVTPSLLGELRAQRVVAMPGRLFWADEAAQMRGDPCPLLRVTFGGLCEQDIHEGFRRLGAALTAAVATEKLLEAAL